MVLHAVHKFVAQVSDPTPQAPPISAQIDTLVRYFTWFVLLSGVVGITVAGGRFAWEKWNNGALASPKMVVGGMLGGVIATSAGTLMNSLIS